MRPIVLSVYRFYIFRKFGLSTTKHVQVVSRNKVFVPDFACLDKLGSLLVFNFPMELMESSVINFTVVDSNTLIQMN